MEAWRCLTNLREVTGQATEAMPGLAEFIRKLDGWHGSGYSRSTEGVDSSTWMMTS